jgi:hypothetical protein
MDLAAKTRGLARKLETIAGGMLALSMVVALSSCSDQPKVRCAVRGQYAAKYTLVSGTGDCALLKGDLLGVATYNGSNGDGTPNWDDATIGIQAYALAALTQGAPPAMTGDSLFSLGHFSTAEPGGNSICEVPTLSAAEVHVSAIALSTTDAGITCPAPAQDVKYEWSNVRAVVSAAVLGTQFAADLKYTANGCTAQYRVWAVSPPVPCAGPTPPPPTDDAGANDSGTADASTDDATTTGTDGGTDATAMADASREAGSNDAGRTDAASNDAGRTDAAPSDAARTDAASNDAGTTDGASSGSMDASPEDGGLPPVCTEPPVATPAPTLDDTLCSPFADLSKNRPLGSGLNPDLFPGGIACDPATVFCVLTRDPTQ